MKKPRTLLIFKNDNVSIWLVDGKIVREDFDEEFIGGGHYYRYDFIPENEVWVEDNTNDEEIINYLIHELFERDLMKIEGLDYDAAHEQASNLEYFSREHPEKASEILKTQLKS